ncbi:MAG: D-alanine--D-alanine ligase [Leptospiraceae bacterium]|nr:D-alanine--D-alanine ligase [Leptospiraceae bacterium]MCP5500505.1 D-alanine--D-alanine ligase [Leptospiraceae bacterium]
MEINLLFGGSSTEHEISILSANYIYSVLQKKYHVKLVYIDKNGNWLVAEGLNPGFPEIEREGNFYETFQQKFQQKKLASNKGIGIQHLAKAPVFLGLHGGQGEDGTLQGLLTSYGFSYTGSKVLGSALAMDKEKSNHIFSALGIPVPAFTTCFSRAYRKNPSLDLSGLHFPLFVKPLNGGSSVGTGIVHTEAELHNSLLSLSISCEAIMIQTLIQGTEVSCGVLEKPGEELFALPPTEIVPKNTFFDYEAKYTPGSTEEITPARISPELTRKVQDFALLAHKGLGCSAYSRTDFIIRDKTPYILETNTLPGMTGTSLIPQQARAAGIQMEDVFDWLVELAKEG